MIKETFMSELQFGAVSCHRFNSTQLQLFIVFWAGSISTKRGYDYTDERGDHTSRILLSLPRSSFLDVTQRFPKEGEHCMTSKKWLWGRLNITLLTQKRKIKDSLPLLLLLHRHLQTQVQDLTLLVSHFLHSSVHCTWTSDSTCKRQRTVIKSKH